MTRVHEGGCALRGGCRALRGEFLDSGCGLCGRNGRPHPLQTRVAVGRGGRSSTQGIMNHAHRAWCGHGAASRAQEKARSAVATCLQHRNLKHVQYSNVAQTGFFNRADTETRQRRTVQYMPIRSRQHTVHYSTAQ